MKYKLKSYDKDCVYSINHNEYLTIRYKNNKITQLILQSDEIQPTMIITPEYTNNSIIKFDGNLDGRFYYVENYDGFDLYIDHIYIVTIKYDNGLKYKDNRKVIRNFICPEMSLICFYHNQSYAIYGHYIDYQLIKLVVIEDNTDKEYEIIPKYYPNRYIKGFSKSPISKLKIKKIESSNHPVYEFSINKYTFLTIRADSKWRTFLGRKQV